MYYYKDTYENIIEDYDHKEISYLNRPLVSPKRHEISVIRCNNFTKFYICIFSLQILFFILIKLNIIEFR